MKSMGIILLLLLGGLAPCRAQYAPQAGLAGSTAISASDGSIVEWATQCTVYRGLRDIAQPDSGYASLGDSSLAIGAADRYVVSLGDSGVAVLTFANPIMDGPGPDFAIFENGFLDVANDSLAFLELAYTEVSSDGVHYVRFPATSLTQTNMQVGNGDYINAMDLDNLAGKYVAMFGTPFDLAQLADSPGLDISNVTHVRIVDVVGAIGAHASLDHSGHVINDPYPTPFASGGFDLDAVGVMHKSGSVEVNSVAGAEGITVFPNPANDRLNVLFGGGSAGNRVVRLYTLTGTEVYREAAASDRTVIDLSPYPAGMYFVTLQDGKGNKWVEKVSKR